MGKLPPTTTRFRTSTTAARDICEDEVDVIVFSHCGGMIYAHANILARASPVIKKLLKQSKKQSDGRRSIHIRGVPFEAVRVFLVYMYASCYDQQQMDDFVVHLLVLSHAYVLPHLKRVCESRIENGMLNLYNVIDIFQLAILCDASRLSLICHRIIIRNFKAVSETDGWMAMKEAHPVLLKKILRSIPQIKMIQKLKMKKKNERKMYVQLYEAMEALVHICRDGCRTIGPHDRGLKEDEGPCKFEACKGLEHLVRHVAACKLKVAGGCSRCKRMLQLFELHSRLCTNTDGCKVPLCMKFKERGKKQNRKEEMRWSILAKKIMMSKSIGGNPYFCLAATSD